MEHARREWLRDRGIAHYSARDDYQFVVAKVDIEYRAPLFMDDMLTISTIAKKIGFASIIVIQQIYRNEPQITADSIPVSVATITLACVDKTLKPSRIPADLMAAVTASARSLKTSSAT